MRQCGSQLLEFGLGRIRLLEPNCLLELANDWIKRTVTSVRRALTSDSGVRLFRNTVHKSFAEVRFSDARLAADEGNLAFAMLGFIPKSRKLSQISVAADELLNLVRLLGLEAAFDSSLPNDAAGAHRIGNFGNLV